MESAAMRSRLSAAAIWMLFPAALVLMLIAPALAQDLCGRPAEAPEALLERMSKVEKLQELSRDKSYVALNDAARGTVWTFTVPGHPAHPTAVCRRLVPDGNEMRLQTNVQCNASEAECRKLVDAFQELNQRMLQEMKKQQKK
jgi:hypothetical protein